MRDSLMMNIVFDVFQNTLHLEDCSCRNRAISEYFLKPKSESELEFLSSIITYLVKVENNTFFEICPYCLGKKIENF